MGANTSAGEPDASGSDEGDTQTALDAIRRIVQALRESSRWAEQHLGVSGAQLFVLQALAAAPNMSVNELAARVHTHQSSVSTVVARLVARGLVRRERSALDGRRVELSLSPRGQRLAARAPDAVQQRLIDGIRSLPPRRRHLLASTLRALADHMDVAAGRAPAMFFEERKRRVKSHA